MHPTLGGDLNRNRLDPGGLVPGQTDANPATAMSFFRQWTLRSPEQIAETDHAEHRTWIRAIADRKTGQSGLSHSRRDQPEWLRGMRHARGFERNATQRRIRVAEFQILQT